MCNPNQLKLCGKVECSMCFGRSFACYEGKSPNGKLKIKCWNNDINNNVRPINIRRGGNGKYWFNCDKCPHLFIISINNITNGNGWCPYCCSSKLCDNNNCKFCFDNSFIGYNKKTQNGKQKVLCWNYIKNNNINPRNIAKSTAVKYWFECDKCPHNFKSRINDVTCKNSWCPYCCIPVQQFCNDSKCSFCFNNSFASSNKKTSTGTLKIKCWDYIKNGNIKPRYIGKTINKKYWFNCDKCPHSFESILANNSWCPYCSNQKLCDDETCDFCFNNSFASFDELTSKGIFKIKCWNYNRNGDVKPRYIGKTSTKKIWFDCDKCSHSFKTPLSNNTWCPYCYSSKLCNDDDCSICFNKSFASFDGLTLNNQLKIKCWDNNKNAGLRQRNISKGTQKKFWFKCDICEHSFNPSIKDITRFTGNTWCPLCKNKTEKKTFQWLKNTYNQDIKYQPKYKWCKSPDTNRYLPFDFSIDVLKLIIEIDGRQHFEQVSNWDSPEDTFEHDEYKMKQAIINGYTIIRIFQEDIYYDKNDWEQKLKKEIKLHDKSAIICIGCEILYQKHNNINYNEIETNNKPHKCDKCNISFKFKSQFKRHCASVLHITGKKKIRSDKKDNLKCPHCNLYTTKQQTNLKTHILNNHKTREERKHEFPFYCELCDSGMLKNTQYVKHIETKKHRKNLLFLKK